MLKLNNREIKSAILGMALGDGHLNKRGNSVKMIICHSKKQSNYIDWKAEILSQLTRIYRKEWNPKNSYNDDREFITISTMVHPKYRDIYRLVYGEGGKRIKRNALNHLTELSLAIWWMDDGNLYHHFKKRSKKERCKTEKIGTLRSAGWEATLSTESFCMEDQKLLIDYLNNKFNVKFNISKIKDKYRLRANGTEFDKFYKIISPYVIQSMKYKIDKNSDWHLKDKHKMMI